MLKRPGASPASAQAPGLGHPTGVLRLPYRHCHFPKHKRTPPLLGWLVPDLPSLGKRRFLQATLTHHCLHACSLQTHQPTV